MPYRTLFRKEQVTNIHVETELVKAVVRQTVACQRGSEQPEVVVLAHEMRDSTRVSVFSLRRWPDLLILILSRVREP